MAMNRDKKILWTMGSVAVCLIGLVVTLVVIFNTEGVTNWRVMLPIGIALIGITISGTFLLFVLKCGCKKEMKRR